MYVPQLTRQCHRSLKAVSQGLASIKRLSTTTSLIVTLMVLLSLEQYYVLHNRHGPDAQNDPGPTMQKRETPKPIPAMPCTCHDTRSENLTMLLLL